MSEEERDLINLKIAISPEKYIQELLKENQQLKEQLERNKLNHKQLKDLEKTQLLNSYQVEKLNEKQEQLDLYKSVIDEIREFKNNHIMLIYTKKEPRVLVGMNKIQEILDKTNIKDNE